MTSIDMVEKYARAALELFNGGRIDVLHRDIYKKAHNIRRAGAQEVRAVNWTHVRRRLAEQYVACCGFADRYDPRTQGLKGTGQPLQSPEEARQAWNGRHVGLHKLTSDNDLLWWTAQQLTCNRTYSNQNKGQRASAWRQLIRAVESGQFSQIGAARLARELGFGEIIPSPPPPAIGQ